MKFFLKSPGYMPGAVLLVSLFSGCVSAPPTLYNWGTYQNQLYARFKTNTSPQQQIHELEKNLQNPKVHKPIAPGYHAHLGLLYGEAGRVNDMCDQFNMEKQLFPESTVFMDFLLTKADALKGNKK